MSSCGPEWVVPPVGFMSAEDSKSVVLIDWISPNKNKNDNNNNNNNNDNYLYININILTLFRCWLCFFIGNNSVSWRWGLILEWTSNIVWQV